MMKAVIFLSQLNFINNVLIYSYILYIGILTCALAQSSYGTDFYIGIMRNYREQTEHVLLYIMTTSSSPVTFTVKNYNNVIITATVTNITSVNVNIPVSQVTLDSSYSNRNKGIHVYTNNEGLISVLVMNYRHASIGEYVAYPSQDIPDLNQYQYYAVSIGAIPDYTLSGVLLTGVKNNTTVTIIPTQTITVPENIQNPSSPNVTITAGTPFSITLHRMQTFLFGALAVDITGTSIVSNKPLSVVSGHECGNVPSSYCCCQHITEQIPPTVTWGRQFLLTPYSGRSGQYYKILAAENQTTFNVTCDNGIVSTVYLSTSGSTITKYSTTNTYCSIVSDKPILVNQLGASYEVDNIGDPVISMVPSINHYSEKIKFVSPPISGSRPVTSHYINIATTSQDTVLMDGSVLSLTWNTIYNDNNIIGYGAQVQITDLNSHTITSQSKLSVLVYGFGDFTGYSYSAGVNLMQLTGKMIKFSDNNHEKMCTVSLLCVKIAFFPQVHNKHTL